MSLLQGPSGPLLFRAPSSDGAFLLTGRRAGVDGHARMGVARVAGPSGEMIRALKVEAADCRRFSYSPGSLLRELEVAGTPVREVVLVPRSLPGAAFQWTRDDERGDASTELVVRWQPGEGVEVVLDEDGGMSGDGARVLARLVDSAGGVRALVLASEEHDWRLAAEGGGNGIRAAATLVPGAPALLAVVEAHASGAPPHPELFDRLAGWERLRTSDEARAEEDLLGAHVPGTELHRGLAWARARLECPALDRPSSDAAWLGLGALCSGHGEVARDALKTLTEAVDGSDDGQAQAHRLLSQQAALWAGEPNRATPEDPMEIPVPGGGPPAVLTRGSLAARADPVQLARALCTFVAGTLGARPDAGFGRLRLAPELPSHWAALHLRNLPMGDVRVDLRYQREDRVHTFTLRQTAGAVPANLVFEPMVAVDELVSVEVDGEPAELDLVRRRGRAGTRVQLPLDAERRIALEGRGNG